MKAIRKVMAVLYDFKNGRPYYLIFHRILRWRGWELLKETIEDDEDVLAAIKRGIVEETGLRDFKIISRLGHKIEWIWGDYRVVVEDVFVVKADITKPISLKQKIVEHDAYLWANKKTALERLTFENTREALERADRKLIKIK